MDGKWVNNELVKGKKVYPYYSKKSKKIHNQIHIGSFRNGKLDGKGEKRWHNATEKGIYKNSKLNGEGTYIFEGKKYTGTFKNNKLINEPQNWWHKISYYLQNFTS